MGSHTPILILICLFYQNELKSTILRTREYCNKMNIEKSVSELTTSNFEKMSS